MKISHKRSEVIAKLNETSENVKPNGGLRCMSVSSENNYRKVAFWRARWKENVSFLIDFFSNNFISHMFYFLTETIYKSGGRN